MMTAPQMHSHPHRCVQVSVQDDKDMAVMIMMKANTMYTLAGQYSILLHCSCANIMLNTKQENLAHTKTLMCTFDDDINYGNSGWGIETTMRIIIYDEETMNNREFETW